MSDLRDAIRSKTLGAEKNFASTTLEVHGEDVEVRQPTVAGKGRIIQKCKLSVDDMPEQGESDEESNEQIAQVMMQKVNMSEMKTWAAIYCTYVPGTDERVFDEVDFDALMKQPAGSWADDLGTEAMQLMNAKPEEDAKN